MGRLTYSDIDEVCDMASDDAGQLAPQDREVVLQRIAATRRRLKSILRFARDMREGKIAHFGPGDWPEGL